ncbi:histidinol-phosphate transaminase [Irineochytrium annulatum]|nr:histidinol-phosphate transaminase [Irineochytrium annulatum]
MPSTHFDLQKVIRPNILALQPYRCARDDYSTGILLDANENAFGPSLPSSTPDHAALALERYPDPHQSLLKQHLASFRGLPGPQHFFLGVGSDESIDLIIRVACKPGVEKVLICPPTYGMYGVCCAVNDVEVVKVNLDVEGGAFQLRVDAIQEALQKDPLIKVIFFCSPGNPTGTCLKESDVRAILEFEGFKGIVVVDEAYIDFCEEGKSMAKLVLEYPNLVVIQTLSKSFGLAGIRLGFSISTPELATIFNNTKAPYNISTPTSTTALTALSTAGLSLMRSNRSLIIAERDALCTSLLSLPRLARILGANDANFVLAQLVDATGKPDNELASSVYKGLADKEGVVVRYRGNEFGCGGCLRITVGTKEENKALLERLGKLLKAA